MAKKKPKVTKTLVVTAPMKKDYLALAEFLPPARIRLVFGDGLAGEWDFSKLEMEADGLRLETIRSSKAGAALEIKTTDGKKVTIDSTAIRMLVDPQFAAELEETTKKFDIPIGKLKDIAKANPPPQWWYSSHIHN